LAIAVHSLLLQIVKVALNNNTQILLRAMSNSILQRIQHLHKNNMYAAPSSPSSRSRKAKAKPSDSHHIEQRHVVIHDYHDHSTDKPTHYVMNHSEQEVDDHKKRNGPRGGVNVPFPTKLHVMLSKVEADGLTDIVSWYVISVLVSVSS
jgi:hypothetical protein